MVFISCCWLSRLFNQIKSNILSSIISWALWYHLWYISLNVKRVKWLLFNRVKSVRNTLTEWKSLSKRVKIIPKWVKITPKKEWKSLQYSEFHFLGKLTEGQFFCFELSLCALPQKVKFTLEWFSLFLEWFSLTLEWFSLVLRAIFTRLERFLHFSLF